MTSVSQGQQTTVLDSGLTVVTASMPHLHAVALGVVVRCGSRYESVTTNGLSHLLEHALYRGCGTYRTTYAFNSAMEACSSGLDGATSSEAMEFTTSCLPDAVEPTLALLGAFVSTPSFADFELERDVVLEELQDDLDAQGRDVNIDNLVRREIFGKQALGLPVGGRPEVVGRFDAAACASWLQRFFVGGNMALVAVGPVEHAPIVEAAARHFATVPDGDRQASVVSPVAERDTPSLSYLDRHGRQADLVLTWTLPDASHPDWAALFLAAKVLDGGSAARLSHRVIDQHAAAYDLGSSMMEYEGVSLLAIDAAVTTPKIIPLVDAIFDVVESLADEPPTVEELSRHKRRIELNLAYAAGSPEIWASSLMQDWLHQDLPNRVTRIARIKNVTAEEVVDASRRHLGLRLLHAAVAGELHPLTRAAMRRRLHRLRPRG